MIFKETEIKGVYIIDLTPIVDGRGWFARTYCKREFAEIGHIKEWVQLNHSFTQKKGTIRGMHFQLPPKSEIKLIRCISGAVMDVVVDLRKSSSTFLKWIQVELSADNRRMIYIPEGMAHGFQALTDNCELIYHHSDFFAPDLERGLLYDDPKLNISWPLTPVNISERDQIHPLLNNDFAGI